MRGLSRTPRDLRGSDGRGELLLYFEKFLNTRKVKEYAMKGHMLSSWIYQLLIF
jgi:hypothetical protein